MHQPWTQTAILSTFLCDLLGGGDFTRLALTIATITEILPPDNL